MQVIISVGGRFHAFYLAQQLLERGYLKKLITSYPRFEVKKYGIPPKKVNSIIITEILERGWRRLPNFINDIYNPQFFICDLFDKLVSKQIEESDIFVGWSSFSLYSLRRAKKSGAVTILERGSSHISYQQQILKEEYEKFGLKIRGAHPKVLEKELKEYEESDYIEVPSSFAKRTFLQYGINEEKLIQGFRGVDLSEFRQIPKRDDVFRIVYVGGMSLRKGVHYLLQAFYELNLLDTELWLIGTMSEDIMPFLKKYNNGRILCKGPYPQKELYKYYSQGSVFILMSIEEGFSNVIVQAMACGLPAICTTNTGGEDIIRNGIDGFIIPIRNVDALKEKIVYLYRYPQVSKEMGKQARKRVESSFTWQHYGDRIIEIYRRILSKE
jgi:glycosyltransferase involved in cell wall biosynthesis